jgi:hypothetical protein
MIYVYLYNIEITPLGSSVLKYDLVTDADDGSGVQTMADDMQTLTEVSFVQFEEAQVSVLTFTQKSNDVGYESIGGISDETSWIFAIGLPYNQWQGKHEVHGSFFLILEDNCVKLNINMPEVITDVEETPHGTNPNETYVGMGDDPLEEEEEVPVTDEPEPELEQPATDEDDTTADEDTNDTGADPDADTGDGEDEDEVEAETPPSNAADDGPVPAPADDVPVPAPAPAPAVVSYECSYVEPRELWVNKVQLEHYKNTAAGTYTMRLTYLKGDAWVSIG